MGKVKYKTPSKNFEKTISKGEKTSLRPSLGSENSIGEYYFLSTENIIPYSKQARKTFPQNEIDQLAQTIREHGVTTPLQVIPSQQYPGKFEVISGERRLRASILSGIKKVPCIILKNIDNAQEIALIENIQRKDLHPIEMAEGFFSIMQEYEWGDISNLANKIGKPQSTISLYLSYVKFPEEIKNYLLEKNIKSREVLRKLIACKTTEEMKKILGIQYEKHSSLKNILRISYQDHVFKIQDSALEKLDKEILKNLKEKLEYLISKIDIINRDK
jgi:ParB family transcriptional regulator, chromosome partitioning protein